MYICDYFTKFGECKISNCEDYHISHGLTYYWYFPNSNIDLSKDAQEILEKNYCNVFCEIFRIQLSNKICFSIDFENMIGTKEEKNSDGYIKETKERIVRLSTRSYTSNEETLTATQWRWFIRMNLSGSMSWYLFESTSRLPSQYILELKYQNGQEVYRFSENLTSKYNPRGKKEVFLMNLFEKKIVNLDKSETTAIRRRPLFINKKMITQNQKHSSPQKPLNYMLCHLQDIPSYWSPIDTSVEYELIPLNPKSLEYLWVRNSYVIPGHKLHILDIFRLQNLKLWLTFYMKKVIMRKQEINLFHGTPNPKSAQAILLQNIDPRLNVRSVHGKGSYFTPDPQIAHLYTEGPVRWVFFCRTIIGDATKSHKSYTRPPLKNPSEPFGELFDSVVDDINKPNVVVIFDQNQYYPEYLISYESNSFK